MSSERYQRIGKLFDEALELAPEKRADFLKQASGMDEGLRSEVEKLLANHVGSEEFFSSPAMQVAAEQTQPGAVVGKQFGHYQILSLIGSGGMGSVYLARDTRLERKVALKVLPPHLLQDAAHVRRFEQEARATSALNHPNILTVYDVGVHEGNPYLVTELLEGSELRAQLPPISKASHLPGPYLHRQGRPRPLMAQNFKGQSAVAGRTGAVVFRRLSR